MSDLSALSDDIAFNLMIDMWEGLKTEDDSTIADDYDYEIAAGDAVTDKLYRRLRMRFDDEIGSHMVQYTEEVEIGGAIFGYKLAWEVN
jgi:hypothetical protein